MAVRTGWHRNGLVAVVVGLTLAAVPVLGQVTGAVGVTGNVSAFTYFIGPIAVAYTLMGVLLLTGARGHLVGWLMLTTGLMAWLSIVAVSWSALLPLAWWAQWSWWPPVGLIMMTPLFFPDGRLPSRRWRLVAAVMAAGIAVAAGALAGAAVDHPRGLLTDVVDFTPRALVLVQIAAGAVLVTIVGMVMALGSLISRWRRADGDIRQQLACLLPSGILLLLGLVVTAVLSGPGLAVAVPLIGLVWPLGMTVAILRYRLLGLDQVINRSIVWLTMTLLVIVGFIAIVAVLRDLVLRGSTSDASLVATGMIAVTFEPLRRRVQRGVERLLYGDRDDPYAVIARLGDLLGRTVEPNAVLPLLAHTIARSLQVPYVAVQLYASSGPWLPAEHGERAATVESFEMVAHGRPVGLLLVATRSPGARFTARERRLLADLALQAAVAAEATRLIRDLQDSRERIIMAREEERLRLRRDLHDGIGPALAGMAMQVRAAHKLALGTTRVAEILDSLAEDLTSCTTELRVLVDQLRPPALDSGLADALDAECRRLDDPSLRVRLEIGADLDRLPAAVEVAAYRIVSEALHNAVRHATASTCLVTVNRTESLTLEIIDDGTGFAPTTRRGVGLDSMRERAVELGGDCEITDTVPHGTTVRVRLPVVSAATAAPTPATPET